MLWRSIVGSTQTVVNGWRVVDYALPNSDGWIHDPAVAPDGTVWYTDPTNSCLGNVDSRGGRFREFATGAPRANPHGLTVDSTGTVWYASTAHGRVGRLDPNTGQRHEFALPTDVRDVHTVLVQAGRIWFTAPGSNLFGSLDPGTGEAEILRGSSPYGLATAPDGAVWIALSGTDSVVRVSPDGARRDWALADPDSRPRRIVSDAAGRIWYNDRDRSVIGMLDPTTGQVREYATVNARAFPSSIAVGPHGRIWYYEVRTGLLIGFDATNGSHESVAFDVAAGGVNHLVVDGPRQQLWLAVGSGIASVAAVR